MITFRAAIVGASGYSGVELASILLRHPRAQIVGLFGSSRRSDHQRSFAEAAPSLRGRLDLPILPADPDAIAAPEPDAVFLCTPHEASLELAPVLRGRSITVFDLSGAFRLKDRALYPKHYGFEHTEPDLLARAVYGLPELASPPRGQGVPPVHPPSPSPRGTGVSPVPTPSTPAGGPSIPPVSLSPASPRVTSQNPELVSQRVAIASADLIAVPGCYPTSAIIPLAPLVRAGAVRPGSHVIVDSTSGVSGAGRAAAATTHFCEVSLQPYNVLRHRHNPEIDAYAGIATIFTPHLGPFDRGILSTIHVELNDGWTGERARGALVDAYAREAFVRLVPAGAWPSVGAVERTNFCDIGLAADDARRHLILVSAIDNLTKGAAGQAIQCMNIRFGLDETAGLLP